jgi:hypothetical protein
MMEVVEMTGETIQGVAAQTVAGVVATTDSISHLPVVHLGFPGSIKTAGSATTA